MADPIDDLVQRWKENPSPSATMALCDALRANPRGALVQQVGEFATQRHAADPAVLVSVARMYMEAHRFADAQAVLVAAGKQAPREGSVYRWLGEVLLRRGDAERAEKVLERAIQLGVRSDDAKLWLERARVFRPMQTKAGTRAVAAEVAHATAPPVRPSLDSLSDSTTAVHMRPVEGSGTGQVRSVSIVEPSMEETSPTLARPNLAPISRKPRFPKDIDTAPRAFETPGLGMMPMGGHSLPTVGEIEVPVNVPPSSASSPAAPARPISSAPPPRPPPPSPPPPPPLAPPLRQPPPPPPLAPSLQEPPSPPPSPPPPPLQEPVPTAPPIPKRPGVPFEAPASTDAQSIPFRTPDGSPMVPHPRDVLDALALAGAFEPPADRGPAVAAWDRAGKGPKRKGGPTLVVGMVLFLAASVGVYFFYRNKRAQEHLRAEALLTTVEQQLLSGKPGVLPDAEREVTQAFQLESRSPRAALDWARERAMVGLVTSGADVAFEDAMGRAKEVGVAEDKVAFAHVASFLFQRDIAGAAAALPRWDGPAANDAWYQLVAGATLERAGDVRARDRYAKAAQLDPRLVAAQVAQVRAIAIDGDAQEAMRMAKALRTSMPDRAEPVALVALAWGRDPRRDEAPAPPEADEVSKREAELPSGLAFVPHAVAALRALDKRDAEGTRAEIQRGLAVADSPGAAVWLGSIALPLGDEALARKAALLALRLSAVYEPARALAARVALLGDRLDEALKATEDLEASSPDVAIVRAAAAYERVDADGVARALEALSPEARKLPFLAAIDLAADSLAGKLQLDPARLMTMSFDDAPWSDLVAMDAALDGGDLASAAKIAAVWNKAGEPGPLRAQRLARLARYEGRLDDADKLSQAALDHGTVTPRVLWERVYVLVARNRAAEVGPLLAHYPLVLGPLASWVSAYAAASAGNVEAAKGKLASVDPPPESAPLEARIVAAAAFGAMKDRRHGAAYVRGVLASASMHPDLVAAALALGIRKVEHGRRRPM